MFHCDAQLQTLTTSLSSQPKDSNRSSHTACRNFKRFHCFYNHHPPSDYSDIPYPFHHGFLQSPQARAKPQLAYIADQASSQASRKCRSTSQAEFSVFLRPEIRHRYTWPIAPVSADSHRPCAAACATAECCVSAESVQWRGKEGDVVEYRCQMCLQDW